MTLKDRHRVFPFRFFLCLWLAVPGFPAWAEEEISEFPAPDVGVGLGVRDFHYKEFGDDGSLLDREDGAVPGVVFDIAQARGKWTWSARFALHAGDVAYDGQTTSGIPLTTRTDEEFVEVAVQANRQWGGTESSALGFYAGLDYRRWVRDIRSTFTSGGLFVIGPLEVYQWWSLYLGVTRVLSRAPGGEWSLDLRVLRTLNPGISVDFRGQFDDASLDLGERYGARVALPWRRALGRGNFLVIEPYLESWKFGRSPDGTLTQGGVPVGTVFEPRSETRQLGILAGYRRPF